MPAVAKIKKSPVRRDYREGFNYYDHPEALRALRDLRQRTGVPLSALVRQGVREVLARHGIEVASPAILPTRGAR